MPSFAGEARIGSRGGCPGRRQARAPRTERPRAAGRIELSTGDALVVAALFVAAGDWVAVARRAKRAEYVCKPLTLILLIAAAVAYRRPPLHDSRWAFTVAALCLSLAGDVFLMLPRDRFVAGLASFLLAHVAYVVALNGQPPLPTSPVVFTTSSTSVLPLVLGAAAVLAVTVPLFLRIRAGILRQGHGELVVPVAVYVAAISAMAASAIGTLGRPEWSAQGRAFAIAGALLFLISDALIGWNRFVRPTRGAPVAVMVTYHCGQAALVLGLLGSPVVMAR